MGERQECRGVLVTGGAGFIGSHVVDRFVREGRFVRVVDNLSTGRLANIGGYLRCGAVDFLEGDIRDFLVARRCVRGVDVVVHLGAVVSVPFSVEHPELTYAVNVLGTSNLLSACVEAGVRRFVFVSSCAVYGEPRRLPVVESHPLDPVSPYAESKLLGEQLCFDFYSRGVLDVVVLRLFNVYGPRQGGSEYSGVITRFLDCVRGGVPLTVFGDGLQTRDFVSVFDVVDVIGRCVELEAAVGEVFNVGVGRPTSINDLISCISRLTGADLRVCYQPARPGDIRRIYADVSKARERLGYEPAVSLEEGLSVLLLSGMPENSG